jgi:hypothetical protein
MTGGYSGPETQMKCTEGVDMKRFSLAVCAVVAVRCAARHLLLVSVAPTCSQTINYEFNDSHFHLTNNIQKGPTIDEFLNMMGNKTVRVALFGVPLQQQWSYQVDGNRAPTYYLHSDAPLYYYSFTDGWIIDGIQVLAEGAAGPF